MKDIPLRKIDLDLIIGTRLSYLNEEDTDTSEVTVSAHHPPSKSHPPCHPVTRLLAGNYLDEHSPDYLSTVCHRGRILPPYPPGR